MASWLFASPDDSDGDEQQGGVSSTRVGEEGVEVEEEEKEKEEVIAYEVRRGGGESESPLTVLVRQITGRGLSFQLWPAATSLSEFLQRNEFGLRLRGRRVLELGAGTGLAGIVTSCLGSETVITDLPKVLPNLEHAVALNRSSVGMGGGSLKAEVLRWGVEEDAARFRQQGFDIILGADIVYFETLFQPLLQTLQWLLPSQVEGLSKDEKKATGAETVERENGAKTVESQNGETVESGLQMPVVLLAHLRRWKRDGKFFRAASRFFTVTLLHRDDPAEGTRKGVEIYSLTRRSP